MITELGKNINESLFNSCQFKLLFLAHYNQNNDSKFKLYNTLSNIIKHKLNTKILFNLRKIYDN